MKFDPTDLQHIPVTAARIAGCTTLVDLMRVLRMQDVVMYEALMCLVRATVESKGRAA